MTRVDGPDPDRPPGSVAVDDREPDPTAGGGTADQGAGARGRSGRRRRWIAIAVAVAAGAVWWVGWQSPATLVRHVVVSVPRGIDEGAVRLASGITALDHVPAVDADRVRASVKAEIPAVADVEVSRSLPHTITLTVTGRTAFAAVESDDGFLLMDTDGVVFDKVGAARNLPVVTSRTEPGLAAAREVLLGLPAKLGRRVERVTARTRDDVALLLKDGATVRWGSSQDAELKARVLQGLLKVRAASYDVSAPLLPTTSGDRSSTSG